MTQSAENAYVAHHAEAVVLVAQLQEALFDLPAPDSETQINWAHVGTVVELKRQLAEALSRMTILAAAPTGSVLL